MSILDSIPLPFIIPGRIGIVGVCGSGKSSLAQRLRGSGYDARECLQEHSFIADMWRRITRPEILVYLYASHRVVLERLETYLDDISYSEELRKLAHARLRANLWLSTDHLNLDSVYHAVLSFLLTRRVSTLV